MADTKISALPAVTILADADQFVVIQSGASKAATAGPVIRAWAGNTNVNTSGATGAQTPAATVRTYVTGSAIAVPTGKLRIGTFFKWQFDITKTAAGSAASTFDIAFGTAGTTADTARVSFTKPAGTAAADVGIVWITAVVRGPLSASGIVSGNFNLDHVGGATGLLGHCAEPNICVNQVSGPFDVTVASLIVGICITTGAADAITIQQVIAEAGNL